MSYDNDSDDGDNCDDDDDDDNCDDDDDDNCDNGYDDWMRRRRVRNITPHLHLWITLLCYIHHRATNTYHMSHDTLVFKH